MFYICIFWTYTSIFEAMFVFPAEKLYLVKERKADMYRLSVYYLCSTMCDLVAHLLNPTLFTSILYFMAGLKRTPQCFFLTLAAVLLISITSHVSIHSLPPPKKKNFIVKDSIFNSKLLAFFFSGSRGAFWSSCHEHKKDRNLSFISTNVVSSHWRLLCSGT